MCKEAKKSKSNKILQIKSMNFYQLLKEHFGANSVQKPLYRKIDWITMGITFLVVFIGYLITLAPDLTLEDSGELAVGSFYAGVPHPPGYPVWTIYTWLFTVLVPISNIAYRVAISSAFASALSCGLIALLTSRGISLLIESMEDLKKISPKVLQSICMLCGFLAGFLFGYNGFIWSQSVIVEVYTFSVLSLVAVLVFMMRWMYAPDQRQYLYLAMFMFGICFTNHQSLLLAAMGIEMMVIITRPTLGREMLMGNSIIFLIMLFGAIQGKYANLSPEKAIFNIFLAVGIFSLIGFAFLALKNKYLTKEFWHNIAAVIASGFCWILANLFYFFMPISSMTNPPMNWGYARTVKGFFHALTRGQYQSAEPTNDLLKFFDQVRVYVYGAIQEFTLPILLLSLIPFVLLFFLKLNESRKKRLYWISSIYAGLFLIGLLMALKGHVSGSATDFFYASSPYTYIGFLTGWLILLVVSIPFVFFKDIAGNFNRSWLAGTTSVFFCLAILMLIVLNPSSDKQSQDLHKVFFTSSYAFFSLWIGYGLAMILAIMFTHYKNYRNIFIYGATIAFGLALYGLAATLSDSKNPLFISTAVLGVLITLALIGLLFFSKEHSPLKWIMIILLFLPVHTVMSHWWDNEQRGHLFGFWFGHDMFTPPFEKDGKPIYPEMTRNAILFGGTDPGRFCPTYMIFCESFIPPEKRRDPNFDRRDVYIITQNALADETYLDYIRAHYYRSMQKDEPFFQNLITAKWLRWLTVPLDNYFTQLGARVEAKRRAEGVYPQKEIYIPMPMDFYEAYRSYMNDAMERAERGQLKSGEIFDPATKTVTGQGAVMGINGLLTKLIFDKNPEHEFFVEESFALDWMYPYLTPYGIILKLNRKPLETFSQEIIDKDHEFWCQYMERLCGNWITYDTTIDELCDFAERVYLRGDFTDFKGDMKFLRDDDAQKAFSKLRSAGTGLYWWRVNYATSASEQSRLLKEAEFAGKQAFAICPFSPEALYKLVNVLAIQNRFAEAKKLIMTTLAFDPENRAIEDLYVRLETMEQGVTQEQNTAHLQELEKLYLQDTNNISNAVVLASTYLENKQVSQAQSILLHILPILKEQTDKNPYDPAPVMYLFELYRLIGQKELALQLFDRLLEAPDLTLPAIVAMAQSALKIDEIEKTEQILQKGVEIAPFNAELIYDLAAMQAMLGKNEESIENLLTALQLNKEQMKTNSNTKDIVPLLKKDARFEKLRSYPRFPQLD